MRVLNLAAAARFLEEVGVLKPVATGAPYVKKVCMGRALLIPATVGENIAQSIKDEAAQNRFQSGSTPQGTLVAYDTLERRYGKGIDNILLGVVSIYIRSTRKSRHGCNG